MPEVYIGKQNKYIKTTKEKAKVRTTPKLSNLERKVDRYLVGT